MTMVGTVLVMELGGASIPDGCNGGRGGGGPVLERNRHNRHLIADIKLSNINANNN